MFFFEDEGYLVDFVVFRGMLFEKNCDDLLIMENYL